MKDDGDILPDFIQYSINPDMRMTREAIFDYIVAHILKENPGLSFQKLKSNIINDYNINLPELILLKTIDKLEKDNVIIHNTFSTDNPEVIYNINSDSDKIKKYGDIEKNYRKKMDQIENWLFARLNKYYTGIIDPELKKKLILDFVVFCRIHAFKQSQELLATSGETNVFECNGPLSYQRSDIDPDIKKAMQKVYEDVQNQRLNPIIREFINITVFWNIFVSILPYSKDIRTFLVNKSNELVLFLDTNVLVSAVCAYDAFHFVTLSQLKYLKEHNIKMFYTKQTAEELRNLIEGVKNAVKVLNNYPYTMSRSIANETRNALLISYFEGRYRKWDTFYGAIKDSLKSLNLEESITISIEELSKDNNLDKDKILNPEKGVLRLLEEKLNKNINAAKHDAILLSLVREIRKNYKKTSGEWFVHWILTLDTGLRDHDREITTEKGKREWPTCIYVPQIRFLFEPYILANAITNDVNSLDDWNIYNSLLEVSQVTEYSITKNLSDSIKDSQQKNISDLLVQYLRSMCWEEYT